MIEVPVANDAEPVLPTLTLMPAGLEAIRSLRPLAVTVNIAAVPGGGVGGVTVSVAMRVIPP